MAASNPPAGRAAEADERDPKEIWRLATGVPEPPDVYEEDDEDEEDEDYADDLPPHWRDAGSGKISCGAASPGGYAHAVV
jgi:hypothetical protein